MKRNSAHHRRYLALRRRYPALYRQDIMEDRRLRLRLSMAEVARLASLPPVNVVNAFKGKAKNHTVYPVCEVLGLDWLQVHNFEIKKSEFHLAVTNGNGSHLAG